MILNAVQSQTKIHNLRLLKRAVIDFNRIAETVPPELIVDDSAMSSLIEAYLTLYLEIGIGNILPNEISILFNFPLEIYIKIINLRKQNKEEYPTKHEEILYEMHNKYNHIFSSPYIKYSAWSLFYINNIVDVSMVRCNINEKLSIISRSTSIPDWKLMLEIWDLSDSEFDNCTDRVWNQLINKDFEVIGEIKHVTSAFLYFSEHGISPLKEDEIISKAKTMISHLKEMRKINEATAKEYVGDDSYAGVMYLAHKNKKFIEFSAFVEKEIQNSLEENYPDKARDLIEKLKNDPKNTVQNIRNYKSDSDYYSTAIFKYIDPDSFVSLLLESSPKNRVMICSLFPERYRSGYLNNLAKEEKWLIILKRKLEQELNNRKHKLSRFHLQRFIEQINASLSTITNYNDAQNQVDNQGSSS